MSRMPITIITGYLGSGKTTLLRHLIDTANKKLAIVMNEFGQIDIDAKVLKGKNVNIAELKGGCVCCSISGEFELAVKEIIAKVKPDHIVVETTGVVDPESLIYDVLEMPFLKLDNVVCVIDCDALARYPEIGETAKLQIEMANVLLLNKTDLIGQEQLADVRQKVRAINKNALVYKTIRCAVEPLLLFRAYTKKDVIKHKHETRYLESITFESAKTIEKEKFEAFLSKLENVFRAKGFVNFPDGTYLVNYANGRWDFEKWRKERTVLVFIGKNLKGIKESLEGMFNSD